jgi:ankyrin repeat protein
MNRAHELIEKIEYYYERINDYLSLVQDLYDVLNEDKMRAFLQIKHHNEQTSSNNEQKVIQELKHSQHTCTNKSPLIIASKKGRLDLVQFFIKQQQADINYQDSNGKSALINACFNNHFVIATYLIQHGAQVNLTNQYGETALFFAYTSKSMLYKYYSYEKIVNYQLSNANMLSLVDLLIQKGIDINHQNIYGQSVLHKVCEEGNLELVKYLIEKGADMNLKDNYDQTPILIALKSKCVAIFNYLLENGADLNTKDKDGNNLLMVACDKGYSVLAKTLIEKGVEIKTKDKHGNSPFYLACLNCNREVVELFIKKGARLNEPNKKGENALFFACLDGNKQKVDLLIRHSVQINQTNRNGENALFYACRDEYCNIYKPKTEQMYEIVKLLMESGIDRELRNNQGRTVLFIACENDDFELVRLILNETRELLIEDEIGNSLLSVAIKHSSPDIVNLIRNRLIENTYNEFQYKDAGKFRDLIAHSIDSSKWFILKWDHLKAFDLLDQKGVQTELEELKTKGILRYFTTVEFQQKFLNDIVDNLKNHREFLENEKRKIENSLYFEDLKSSSLNYKKIDYLNKKAYFKYAELRELLKDKEIIHLIEMEKSKEAEESMTLKLWKSLRVLIQSVNEKLQLSNDFNTILYQKVLLKFKKRNRIKKMLGYYE